MTKIAAAEVYLGLRNIGLEDGLAWFSSRGITDLFPNPLIKIKNEKIG